MKISRIDLDNLLDTLAKSLSVVSQDDSAKDVYAQALRNYDARQIVKACSSLAETYKPTRFNDFPVIADIISRIPIDLQDESLQGDLSERCESCFNDLSGENTGFVYVWFQFAKDGKFNFTRVPNSPFWITKYVGPDQRNENNPIPDAQPPLTPCVARCTCKSGQNKHQTAIPLMNSFRELG